MSWVACERGETVPSCMPMWIRASARIQESQSLLFRLFDFLDNIFRLPSHCFQGFSLGADFPFDQARQPTYCVWSYSGFHDRGLLLFSCDCSYFYNWTLLSPAQLSRFIEQVGFDGSIPHGTVWMCVGPLIPLPGGNEGDKWYCSLARGSVEVE